MGGERERKKVWKEGNGDWSADKPGDGGEEKREDVAGVQSEERCARGATGVHENFADAAIFSNSVLHVFHLIT